MVALTWESLGHMGSFDLFKHTGLQVRTGNASMPVGHTASNNRKPKGHITMPTGHDATEHPGLAPEAVVDAPTPDPSPRPTNATAAAA